MPARVSLRTDFTADDLRKLAAKSSDAHQSRRLLSLAAVRDGMRRGDAARIGGMDRQTLRDWVHRFNAEGPEGLIDRKSPGPKRRLSAEQLIELEKIVETGPDFEKDGVGSICNASSRNASTSPIMCVMSVIFFIIWGFRMSAHVRSIPNRTRTSSQRSKKSSPKSSRRH